MSQPRVCLVTGANRGIGLEVARQLARAGDAVVLAGRNREKLEAAAAHLRAESPEKGAGLQLSTAVIDVSSEASIRSGVAEVLHASGRIDVLVNNAGVLLDQSSGPLLSAFDSPRETVLTTIVTNALGPFQLCQLLIPEMVRRGYGRVVNVSSGAGQLAEMDSDMPGYRISKTALNAVTRIFAEESRGKGVLVNSVCPGWVRTDMGGPEATRPVEKGAETIVWAASLPPDGPTGGFFRDRNPIPW